MKSTEETTLIVKGKNFKCPENDCSKLRCRFGEGSESIYTEGTRINDNEIQCKVPIYSKPDVLRLEVTLNGQDFTNNGFTYGYFDPFIYKVTPPLVSKRGNTTITIHGHGFVNTSSEHLKVRFGFLDKKLSCNGRPCIKRATFIDKNTIITTTFAYREVVYEETQEEVNNDKFAVEVSVYRDPFTCNNITIFYFDDPIYSGIPEEEQNVPANGKETILIPTNFKTKYTEDKDIQNDELWFRNWGNVTCRYKTPDGREVITLGDFTHDPIGESEHYNAVFCKSPDWDMPDDVESEPVTMDMSLNGGADYSGGFTLVIAQKLELYRIFPLCGPVYGKTRLKVVGTGLRKSSRINLKWGVVTTKLIEKESVTEYSYHYQSESYETKYGFDSIEEQIISQNEDMQMTFKESKKYQTVITRAPQLPNWTKTHGGPMYLELGRTSELKVYQSKEFKIYNYGPTFVIFIP